MKKQLNHILKNVAHRISVVAVFFFLIFSLPFGEGWGGACKAQIYPIQATTILTPPFSGYIPDYSSPGNEQMKVILVCNDFSQPFYDVKLKIKIEGQGIVMQSKAYYFSQPFTLTPGVPFEVTGDDLAGLLSINNLDFAGISISQYNEKKVLPEGIYSICITVYDYNNPLAVQVSNTSCSAVWMMLNDPPYLNSPFCGSELNVLNPQQVTFMWTPMNLVSPNSFNQTEYEFSLYEIRPNGQNPNIVVQNSAPIYQITTNQTVLNYGMAEPPLLTGMSYAWRVRVIDISGRDWFKNNGYSQVCVFKWGNELDQLGDAAQLHIQAQALTNRKGRAWWDSLNVYSSYKFEFRKAGANNQWFPVTLSRANTFVDDLESETTYEVRVQGETPDGTLGPWSNTATFTTPPLPVYVCGQMPPPVNMQNYVPLQAASPGMVWTVGQFEMIVTQLNTTVNPMGMYSGYGKVLMGFAGINANCKFDQIMIDKDRVMRMGVVRVMTQPMDEWINGGQEEPDYIYNGDADSVYVQNNIIVIVGEDGNTTEVPWPGGNYVIEDENGDQWVVDGNGHVTFVPHSQHVELSSQEISIYRTALAILKNEYEDGQIINQAKSDFDGKAQNLSSEVNTVYGINYLNVDTAGAISGYLYFDEVEALDEYVSPYSSVQNTREARIDLESAKVSKAFGRINLEEEELDLLANGLIINNQKSYLYIREQLQTGKSSQALSLEVKNELKNFIKQTISKKY